jgi:hypothetical protein
MTETKLPAEIERLIKKWRNYADHSPDLPRRHGRADFISGESEGIFRCADELEALAPVLAEREKATTAAALREAADVKFEEPTGCTTTIRSGLSEAAKQAILALITPDAQSALDRHDAKIETPIPSSPYWDGVKASKEQERAAGTLLLMECNEAWQKKLTALGCTHNLALLRAVRDEAEYWCHRFHSFGLNRGCMKAQCDYCSRLAVAQRAVQAKEGNAKANDLPGR